MEISAAVLNGGLAAVEGDKEWSYPQDTFEFDSDHLLHNGYRVYPLLQLYGPQHTHANSLGAYLWRDMPWGASCPSGYVGPTIKCSVSLWRSGGDVQCQASRTLAGPVGWGWEDLAKNFVATNGAWRTASSDCVKDGNVQLTYSIRRMSASKALIV